MRILFSKIFNILKNHKWLVLIILVGFLFRVYRLEDFYTFEHDQDLYSWIVKDILVDNHFRLIGQLTSVDGVFIGPIFYYLLVPFYFLFNMNPLSTYIPITAISLFTIFSFYYVISRHFNKILGLIAAFVYATSLGTVFFDRWIVPTQPTILWSIWYMHGLLSVRQENGKHIVILFAILIGLIWHIHIALLPLLMLIPISYYLLGNGKLLKSKIKKKDIFIGFVIFLFLTVPFWIFEIRHGFQQANGFLKGLTEERGEVEGTYRLIKTYANLSRSLASVFYIPAQSIIVLFLPIIFLIVLFKSKILKTQITIFVVWILLSFLSLFLSKRNISEYYFANLVPIWVLSISLAIFNLFKFSKKFTIFLLLTFFSTNALILITRPVAIDSYYQKERVVEFIKQHTNSRNYACISINYIAEFGTGVGFRYLFWLNNLHLINPGIEVPVYNIVIPWTKSKDEIDVKYGNYGVILPTKDRFNDQQICNDPKNQLLPLLGFTK